MFTTPAYAQQAAPGVFGGGLEALLPLVLIFVVFYFLLIRPQQKKMKQHKEMLTSIRRGDRVVTGGGILGTVTKVNDENELTLEIADDVRVRVQRGLLSAVISKTEPVKGEAKKDEKDEKGASESSAGTTGAAEPPKPAAAAKEGPLDSLKKLFGVR